MNWLVAVGVFAAGWAAMPFPSTRAEVKAAPWMVLALATGSLLIGAGVR